MELLELARRLKPIVLGWLDEAVVASTPGAHALDPAIGPHTGTLTLNYLDQSGASAGQAPVWSGSKWTPTDVATQAELDAHNHDHGTLMGLDDDDHGAVYPGLAQSETITGLWTFDRDPNAPFAVTAGSGLVTNLDADLLDGQHASAFATAGHNHDHGTLTGLGDDDHGAVYPGLAQSETITGLWTFDRDPNAPFAVAAGSALVTNLDSDKLDGQHASAFAAAGHNHDHGTLTGLGDNDHPQYVLTSRTLTAGNGLTGGGDLTADRTFTLGTPSLVSVATDNEVTATSHTHAISTSSDPGVAASILATAASGLLQLENLYVADKITHKGDIDTYIAFTADQINFYAGGVNILGIVEGAADYVQIPGSTVDLRVGGGIYVGNVVTDPGTGDICYSNNLRPERNSILHTGYVFVPETTPWTHASWSTSPKSDVTSSTQLDISSFTGAPANTSHIKALLLEVECNDSAAWGTSLLHFSCGPSSTYWYAMSVRPAGGDVLTSALAVVPTDGSGDVWYRINASGSGTMDVTIRVWGYFT